MITPMIDFANLLLAALLVGIMFGVWLFLNPAGLDGKSYVVLQQQAIRTLNKVMPALGAATILVTVTAAVFGRDNRARFGLLLAAVICLLTTGLITRFLNQPINAIVMTWRGEALPSNWTDLRDDWWRWHLIRLVTGLAGLSAVIAAILKRTCNG